MVVDREPNRGAQRSLTQRVTRLVLMVALAIVSGVASVAAPLFVGVPAGAETPTEVIEDLTDNVYIGRTRSGDVDATMFVNAISEAAQDGHRLLVIAPDESIPSGEAFALRVRQAGDADITISFTEEGVIEASVSEELNTRENQALDAARAASNPQDAADAYVETLLTEPVREVPETIRQVVNAVIYLTLALGVVVLIELLIRAFRRQRHNKKRKLAAEARQAKLSAGSPSNDPDREIESASH